MSEAQNGRFSYLHEGKLAPRFITYVSTSGTEERSTGGSIDDLKPGCMVCMRFDAANPLLYAYSASAETLKIEVPIAATELIAKLGTITYRPGSSQGALPAPGVEAIDTYVRNLSKILELLRAVEELKWRSDEDGFRPAWSAWDSLRKEVSAKLSEADAQSNLPALKDPSNRWVLALKGLLTREFGRASEEWTAARSRLTPGTWAVDECVPIGRRVIRARFHVAERVTRPEGQKPQRFLGEVFNVRVDPRSDDRLAVVPGAMIGIFDGLATYSVKDGVVAVEEEDRFPVRPSLMFHMRPSDNWSVWPTVGIGTGADATERPDLFLGLAVRVGGDPDNPMFTLGLGGQRSWFRNRLPVGIGVGSPLPPDIENLDRVLKLQGRWGVGIILMVHGSDLLGSK